MTRFLPVFLASALLLSPATEATEAPPALVSGVYDALILANDPDSGKVTGYLNATRGEEPRFNCIFFIEGMLAGSQVKIVSYFPLEPTHKIAGAVVLGSEDVRLDLVTMPDGCSMEGSLGPQTKGGGVSTHLSLLALHQDWKQIRVVKDKKAYLSKIADVRTRQKAYLVEGDGVAVIGAYEEWRRIEFIDDKGKTVRGWLPEKAFYPLLQP